MTLNQLIYKLIKPIAEDHLQINDFGVGDLHNHATGKTVKYPLMWVVLNNGGYGNKAFSYSLTLIFADIAKDDLSNAIEIQSDMISVAADVAVLLRDNMEDDIEVDNEFTFTPFSERFTDMTSGVAMNITVRTLEILSDCDVPLKSNL